MILFILAPILVAGLWLASAIYVATTSIRLVRAKISGNASTPVNRALWKKLLLWTLGSIFWIPTSLLTGTAALNYSGYCFKQSRYLSDEERIRSAVENALTGYPAITYAYDVLPKRGYEVLQDKSRCCGQGDMSRYDKSQGAVAIDPEQLIPYRDIDEFFAVNPDWDCCSFARRGLYGEEWDSSLWLKLTGYSAGFTNVKFRVRYRNAAGIVQTKFSAESSNLTNCGRGVSPNE